MRTNYRNLNRLLKFAREIGSLQLKMKFFGAEENYQSEKTKLGIEYFGWAFASLPSVFPRHWMHDDHQVVCLISDRSSDPLKSFAAYFQLAPEESFHLLVPGYQNPDFLGKELDASSDPSDLVHNIYQFIIYKESQTRKLTITSETKN